MSVIATEETTSTRAPESQWRRLLADVPLLVVAVLLASTAADILPGDNIVGVGEVQLNLARLLILIGFVALLVTQGARRELFRAGTALPIALLLLAGLLASHKWGTYPRYRFLVEGVAAFYLTFAVIKTRVDSRDGLAAIGLVALAIAALIAVGQVAQGVDTGFYRHGCTPVTKPFGPAPADSITRATGTFANPNVLAGYLLLLIPVGALAAAFVSRVRGMWVPVTIAVALGYLAVVFTFSRAAVLISLAALGVGVLVSRTPNRVAILAVVAALAVAVLFLVGSCGSSATAGYGRGEEWRQTLEVIGDNPVYGVGLGRLGDVLHARDSESTARHAHNLFLTWWAEAGTGALIAWLWLCVVLLWRSLRGALTGDPVARSALVALVGFFGYSMTDHPANVDRVALAFWIVAAIGAASLPVARGQAAASGADKS
jgi:O-antigen ligase